LRTDKELIMTYDDIIALMIFVAFAGLIMITMAA
jgi:hypothetical protein